MNGLLACDVWPLFATGMKFHFSKHYSQVTGHLLMYLTNDYILVCTITVILLTLCLNLVNANILGCSELWTEVVPLLPGSCTLTWTGPLVFIHLPISHIWFQVPHPSTLSQLADQMTWGDDASTASLIITSRGGRPLQPWMEICLWEGNWCKTYSLRTLLPPSQLAGQWQTNLGLKRV